MEKKQKYLAALAKLRLMDDTLMTSAFEDNIEGVTLLLHILLERDDLVVKQVTAQKKYTNLLGHSAQLDIVAEDAAGKLYDIEVQQSREGADPRRARYYSSLLDSRLLDRGEDYASLKDSYVIFITERDVFQKGLPLYHFERTLQEGGDLLEDGSHILYVNGTFQDTASPVGRLMYDFHCTNADEMLHPVLAERVRYLKEDEGGQSNMCAVLEELVKQSNEEAIKQEREAAKKDRERIALELLMRSTFSEEEIAEISHLTLEEIKTLNAQRPA